MSDDLIRKQKNRIRFPGPDTVSKEKGGSIVRSIRQLMRFSKDANNPALAELPPAPPA
jgi:hypothetical protein